MKTTPSPAVEWPPGGAASSTRSASHGKASTDFGALLDTHQARTATAEGPKKEAKLDKDKPVVPAVREQQEPASEAKPAEGQKPEASEAQQPQPEGDQPTVETPVVVVEPVVELPVVLSAAPATPAPAPEQPAAAPAAPQPEPQQQQQLQPEAPAASVATAAPVAEQTAEVAAAVAHQPVEAKPQQPQGQAPVVAGEQPTDATPEQPVARADKPAQPQGQQQAQTQQQPQQQAGDQPRQQPHADQRVADQPRIATQEQPVQQRVATAAEPRADRAQPQPVQANASTTGLTNAAAPTAPQAAANRSDVPVRAVPLSRAADAVENVIRLGSQRGVTHARLSLRPADLGGVEIRLQQTATGLTASVVADGVEAAQALLQAGAELRQKLEAHGIQLQSLDISYSGDEQADARSAAAQTGDGEQSSATGDSSSTATDGGELTPTEEISVKETLELPDGVLVDVLA